MGNTNLQPRNFLKRKFSSIFDSRISIIDSSIIENRKSLIEIRGKFLTLLLFLFFSSLQVWSAPLWKGTLLFENETKIPVTLALTREEKQKGLSGIKNENFSDQEGMLFYYARSKRRYFWMPDTHFDLDIFFLDKEFKVIAVERDVPHHKGRVPPIPRTKRYYCRHVLELKASSSISKEIKVGDQLKFESDHSTKDLKKRLTFY